MYICHWQATNKFKLRTRLSINSPSCKRKSSAINGRLPSPIIIALLVSLSAICRACRGCRRRRQSLNHQRKLPPPILPAHRPYEGTCAVFLCNRWWQFPLVVEALPPPSATHDTPYILLTKKIKKAIIMVEGSLPFIARVYA